MPEARSTPGVTTTTVTVIRPVKLIALICGFIALILLLAAVIASYWLTARPEEESPPDVYHQGLWEECYDENRDGDFNEPCQKLGVISESMSLAYVRATAAFLILAMIVDTGGMVLIAIGLLNKDAKTKKMLYRIAAVLMFVAVAFGIIALSVFAAEFMGEIDVRSADPGVGGDLKRWYFNWCYGVAWGAVVFFIAAGVLLVLDTDEEEVYYAEKQYATS